MVVGKFCVYCVIFLLILHACSSFCASLFHEFASSICSFFLCFICSLLAFLCLSLPFSVGLFHFYYFFMLSCLPLFSVVRLFLLMSLVFFPFLFVYFCISFPAYCFASLLCFLLCPLLFLPACLPACLPASLYAASTVTGCRTGGAPT